MSISLAKLLIRVFIGALAFALVLGGILYSAMRPPAALPVPERGLLLSGVTLVEPGVARTPGRFLRIEGSAIAEIGEGGGPGPFAGSFVLPGLVDMHGHFPPPSGLGQTEHFAALYLLHGVTAVRHAGDVDGTTTDPVREGVREGRLAGPRIFACGPFVDGDRTLWPNSRTVQSEAEARAVVEEIAAAGFDCIKIYNDLRPQALESVRRAAREHGLPLIGHVPVHSRFEEARLDDTQHLTGMAVPDVPPTPWFPKNMRLWREVDDVRRGEIVAAALAYDLAVTPTLVVMDRQQRFGDPEVLRAEPDAAWMARYYRDVVWQRPPDFDDAILADFRDAHAAHQQLVRELVQAGVRVHVGTDTLTAFAVPGASMFREMRLFANAGLSAEQVVALATRGNGADLPLPGLGRLEAGAPADLAIFERDPTRDLAHLDSLVAVVADGRLYRREDLEAQVERMVRYQRGRIFDRISVSVARRMMDGLREE